MFHRAAGFVCAALAALFTLTVNPRGGYLPLVSSPAEGRAGPVLTGEGLDRLGAAFDEISAQAASADGRVSVTIMDLEDGALFSMGGDDIYPAASVIKVMIMAAAFRRFDAGDGGLNERFELAEVDRTSGSGSLKRRSHLPVLTLGELIERMITESDNTAANALIRRFGMDELNAEFSLMGLESTRLDYRILDREARRRGLDNPITGIEAARTMAGIFSDKIASPASCREMREILRRQRYTQRLPRFIPEVNRRGNKTGTLREAVHDLAAMSYDGETIVISVLTTDFNDAGEMQDLIAYMGLEILDSMRGEGRNGWRPRDYSLH